MPFNTYSAGLKNATDLANKAIAAEASLSTLSPLVSPLPTLQKAFPLYIASAEAYSHLLTSALVAENDRPGLKKKWRLVLDRAEKVKRRVEELGGHVGRAEVDDAGQEDAIRRRGGILNSQTYDFWYPPPEREFRGAEWREKNQPELANEQPALDPVWTEVDPSAWRTQPSKERVLIKQGPGADCSVVAGFCACLEHDRRWGTRLAQDTIFPQNGSGSPIRSENGKHVVKLLLNSAWRSVVIDALLPHYASGGPLFATTQASASDTSDIGPPWIPLAMKGYFKAFGGYSLRGSNPAPDIYTLTGWIPEQLSLKDGFRREKEWRRIHEAWEQGEVLVTLGTGEEVGEGLVALHAYAVLGMSEDGDERVLEVYDPGITKIRCQSDVHLDMDRLTFTDRSSRAGVFTMAWDAVCTRFETLSLNWSPTLLPVVATKYWYWPKPSYGVDIESTNTISHFTLDVAVPPSNIGAEVWILLSQHITNKDRTLDDISLYVHEDFGVGFKHSASPSIHRRDTLQSCPYSNAVHVLVRHTIRRAVSKLSILPIRDQGLYRTDFSLHVLAPTGSELKLERTIRTMPFSAFIKGSLIARNAGGHGGMPSWMDNPQYQLVLSPQDSRTAAKEASHLRVTVRGDKDIAWNIKLLWSKGDLIFEWTEEMIIADSGAYAYGMAYFDKSTISAGTYTIVVSAFEPQQTGDFHISLESTLPVSLKPIPAEGAGMYSRTVVGAWTKDNTGGRPSGGLYHFNPKMEITLPKDCTLMARAFFPTRSATRVPLNLTLFRRGDGGIPTDQLATSGPYADALCGVSLPRTRVSSGLYILVVSPWDRGMGIGETYQVRIWADGPLEVEAVSGR